MGRAPVRLLLPVTHRCATSLIAAHFESGGSLISATIRFDIQGKLFSAL